MLVGSKGSTCLSNRTAGSYGSLEVVRTIFRDASEDVKAAIVTQKHVSFDESSCMPKLLDDV